MKRSTKFSISDTKTNISADIAEGETKEVIYEGHKYEYRVDRYTMYKDYCALVVTGGPHNYRATTTCKRGGVKKRLKTIILLLKHK